MYRSHPARFRFPEGMSGPERRFAMLASVYGLGGVFAAQPWRWLDHPSAVADASYKPHQLKVATECGLNVPPSLVTNIGAEARKFAAEVGGDLVYKSLSTGVVAEQDELSYQICSTPDEVRSGVVAYLRRFALTFGAFDFSVTADGHWWFLECNPGGRWSWISEETGQPIAEAIADELTIPT